MNCSKDITINMKKKSFLEELWSPAPQKEEE